VTEKWTNLEESWEILDPLSDPYVGIIRRESNKLHDIDGIWLYSYGAQVTDSSIIFGVPSNPFNGGGSPNPAAARLAALGETVERYSATYCPSPGEDVVYTTQKDLIDKGELVIGYDSWELFAPEQYADPNFPYDIWDENTELWWTKGTDAKTNRPVWTPASLLYMIGKWDGDAYLADATSNGLACGIQPIEAAINGLLETVERDAFMLTWYNKLSLPLIDIQSSPRLVEFFKRYIDPTFLEVNLVDMTIFSGIPTVLAVVRNTKNEIAPIGLGASSAASLEIACEKAASEAMYTRSWGKMETREKTHLYTNDYNADINDFSDHIKLFIRPDMIKETEFLTSSKKRVSLNKYKSFNDKTPQDLWDDLTQHLFSLGFNVATFDLTSPDIRDAGASVIKTLIPKFRPLDVTYRGRMLGGERLRSHAYNLGLVKEKFDFEDFNPTPHPFP